MDRKDEAPKKLAMEKPYNDYNSYLRRIHGAKVYKIGLDAGFSCPNRDGTKGRGGCTYCTDNGSRSSYTDPVKSVAEQLSLRMEYLKKTFAAEKFIAYFQAFTNTHAPVKKLKSIYDDVLPFDGIVGISIGTRPDCVDDEKMRLISSYRDRYEMWIEYGLQSVNEDTLVRIERRHTLKDFITAVELAKRYGIKTCAHLILGFPEETGKDIVNAAKIFNDLKIDGIKIHLLHILKGSRMENIYKGGGIKLLDQTEYVDMVCDLLENISPDIVIQRLTGEGDRENHIAPLWALDKTKTIRMIEEELTKRGTRQGKMTPNSILLL